MSKLSIFIDFEAISNQFNYLFKNDIKKDIPYAYSIGIYNGKKFFTKTHIVNFNKVGMDEVNEHLRISILGNIRQLIGNPRFVINRNSAEFVGWSAFLEKKLLSKIYRGIDVRSLNGSTSISLKRVTESNFEDATYFAYLKTIVNSLEDKPDFIDDESDGRLAAYAGFLLLSQVEPVKIKHKKIVPSSYDVLTLLGEIRGYSVDDVNRMTYVHENYEEFLVNSKEWMIIVNQNNKKRKELKTIEITKALLQEKMKEKDYSISELISELESEEQDITKEIDLLKNESF